MTTPVVKDEGARAVLPPFGAEHEELRQTVARFVAAEVAPHVDEWEKAREFPRDLYRRCAELGFLGPIGGGTDEVMKEIIGRTLGL